MFERVGYGDVWAQYDRDSDSELVVNLCIKEDSSWLSLEELHQLKEVVDHMIAVVTAKELKGG